MKKIHSLFIVAVLLMITATRAAGQTYTSGQFKYELAMAGGETFAYITGLANSSSTVSVITIPGVIEHTDGKAYYTNIDAGAFKDNYNLTDVTVGYGCRVIFNNAFAYCANLKTLRLPSSITGIWQGIVNGAAQNGLKVYAAMTTIPNTHSGAWMGIPKNKSYFYTFSSEMREKFVWNDEYFNYFDHIWKEEIPQLACDYRNTSGHKNCYIVTKPSTKTTDGEMMLVGTYHEPGTTFEVGVGTSNAELMLPDYKVTGHKTYLTKVMDGAYFQTTITSFYSKCSKLQEIGSDAFRECNGLQEVHIEDANAKIGVKAFMKCEDLTSVWVNTSIICDSAFCHCEKLNDLTLAEGVKKIEAHSFSGCNALTAVHFPASLLQLIGRWEIYGTFGVGAYSYNFCTYGGFHSLPNLKTITVAEGNPYYSAFDNILYYDINSKKQLCFCPCGLDINPTFPTSLKTIKESAFYNVDYLTTVEIPYGVEEISDAAFVQCKNLRYVKTPSTAEVSPQAVFYCGDGGNLKTVCYANPPYFSSVQDRIQFGNRFYPDNFYVPAGDHQLSTTTGHVAMERAFDTYNSGQDTDISYGAYDILTDEGIPLLLNKQAKTAKVVYGRFDEDYTAQLSGVINIPSTYTYDGITYTVTAIDMHAFEGNQNITSITIPSTVTSFIGTASMQYEGAEEDGCQFKTCTSLRTVRLPKSITTIPNYCFFGNKHSEMRLPYGIERIGYKAFASNAELISLFVPSSVKERGSIDQTFVDKCVKLNNLYMNTAPDAVLFSGSSFFPEVKASCRLYVPVGKYNSFYNVQGWQHFNTIKAGSYDFSYPGGGVYSVKSMGNGSNHGEVVKVYNRDDDGSFNSGGIGVPINIPETVSDGWGRSFTVVELGDSCMAGSFGSTSVTIPATVRQIGSQAMKDMTSLQKVTTKMTTLPVMGSNVWENVNQANVQLFYPEGMYEDYSTASQWKEFYMEEPLVEYDLTVNETKVTNKNRSDIPITSGKATYEPLLRRLTLEDAVIDCAALGEECRPIVSGIDNMTIRFVGDCRITGSCTSAIMLLGSYNRIEVTGHTVIEAKYDLTGNMADGYSLDGIISDGIVSLTGGGKLTIGVDCDGIYTRGYTFYVTNTTLEVESRDRVAFLNGHLDLSLDEGHTVAFKGRGGAMTQSLYDYSGSCVFLTPADARYEYFAGGFVDSSGELIKNEWVVIGSQHTPTTIEYAAGSSTAEGDLQSPTYNLQGQRVGKGYQGIIIRNGKKMKN